MDTTEPQPEIEQMLSAAEIAESLKITIGTWRRWEREGFAPAGIKIGPRAVRWKLSEVQQWLDEGKPWQGPRPLGSRRVSVFQWGAEYCNPKPRDRRPCEMTPTADSDWEPPEIETEEDAAEPVAAEQNIEVTRDDDGEDSFAVY